MKLTIDTDAATLSVAEGSGPARDLALYSPEAFEILSREWVRLGWDQKYSYTFTWFGRPVIQLPEDMLRTQEVLWQLKPDVIVETGVAHGGSLVFYASLCRAMGTGRVVGIDIEIRPANRAAIESHPLRDLITLIEGSSTDAAVLAAVRECIAPGERVLVLLDSNHTYEHVARELELYAPLVTAGSYIVATDGLMQDLHDVPNGQPHWSSDNPAAAAREFAAAHPEFELGAPAWAFNESELSAGTTYWPDAWLRRR